MNEYENLKFEINNDIAYITINRPKALNALNKNVFDELNFVLDKIATNDIIKIIIFTGAGDKAFIAGADIAYMLPMSAPEGKQWSQISHNIFDRIENCPQIVIAAINGFTLGGGCEFAMACDIRIASENALFGQPEVGLGIIPGGAGTQRLPRLVGKGRAKEILFTGSSIDAEEAYRIGLVNKVVAQADLMAEAEKMAKKIMKNAPYAVRLCKEAINIGMEVDLKTGSQYEGALFGTTCATADKQEGMDAFLNKRKPIFTGE